MKFITSVKVLVFIGLIIKTDIWAFRCNNGNEILDSLFCNGNDDCGDRSDETYGCSTRRYCKKGKFTCISNRMCMSITIRCNGIIDCPDQSDEQNCVEQTRVEVQPQTCLLEQGKFLCKNKWACIDFSSVCDDRCNCADCSDENTENCTKLDSESCRSCTQFCLPTPDGPRCACNSTNYETSSLCKEIQDCTQGSQCEQHCTRYKNFQRCLCYDGYHEVSGTNGEKCEKNMWLETVLLYSTVTKIKFINLTKNSTEIAQNSVYCTTLTAARDHIYYGSLQNNKGYIYKSPMIEGGVPEKIVEVDSRVTSISVDWVTNNVYFTSNKSLSVCTNNSAICTRLKCCGINSVALAPKIGRMFYIQDAMIGEDDQFIMKSNMDGTEEDMQLSDECFMQPISLTIDEDSGTIFWLEAAEQKLHSVSFDGSNRKIQLLGNDGFSSLTALRNKFYFTKNRDNSYYYSDALPNVIGHQDNATSSIRHLYIYSIGLQQTQQIENPCATASCTSLCLTRPSSLDGILNYTCVCENFTPTDDNNWCVKDQEYSVQNEDCTARTEIYSTTEPNAVNSDLVKDHSTTEQSQITTNQEIHSSIEPVSTTTNPPDDISSTTISSETPETQFPTEPTETTNSPTQPYSPTEHNEIMTTAISTTSTSNFMREGLMDYVLIYSTVTKIKAWHLSNDELEVIEDGVDSTALAGIGSTIYYATCDDNTPTSYIYEISADSAQRHEFPILIVRTDSRITTIGVDWITNNVYFTTNVSLSVCSSKGEICVELKCCDTDAVALAPSFRWMFFTHKMISDGKDLIIKSGMDGSNEKVLLDESFYQLSSLTVDESNERVYWMTTEDQILHSVSFSGNEKKAESLKQEHFSYKHFGTLEGNFFLTAEPSRLVWKSQQWVFFVQDNSTNYVKFLHAYRTSSQNIAKVENPCKSLSCTGLCLLSPGLSSVSCICENFIQTDEYHWCNKKTEFPAVLKSNDVSKHDIHLSTETSGNFSWKEVHQMSNYSSVSIVSPATAPLQSEYLMASGVLGFILGISSASFIILVFYVFQRHSHKKSKRIIKINDEMEM